MTNKCEHIIAFHIGHGTYTKEQYEEAKKRDDLDCCGGTILCKFCPLCGRILK
jgi:hypothetical protein